MSINRSIFRPMSRPLFRGLPGAITPGVPGLTSPQSMGLASARDDGGQSFGSWAFGTGAKWGHDFAALEDGALSYANVQIPAGATITSATLSIDVLASNLLSAEIAILNAEAVVNASQPANGNLPSSWTVTATNVFGLNYTTPGVKPDIIVTSLVQELVTLGLTAGNRINFRINPIGSYVAGHQCALVMGNAVLTVAWA